MNGSLLFGMSVLQWLFLGNFICGFTPLLHHGGIEPYESACSMAIQGVG